MKGVPLAWSPEVKKALNNMFDSDESEKTAVFDADGTLWHHDLGEAFFKHQIQTGTAPGLQKIKDPWAHYKKFSEKDAPGSYAWLAQINAGISEDELLNLSRSFYEKHFSNQISKDMRKLIKEMISQSFDIWICTASIKWAIAPALEDLGLPLCHLIGVEVKLDGNKKLTTEVVEPIPYRSGKKLCLEKKLKKLPTFVAGNSMGDLDMMSLATKLPLAIVYKPHLPEIKSSEEALLKEAKKRNWLIQIFQ